MAPEEPPLFSRDELSRGLPARRASTLLFAIEALTAQLAARRRRAMATYLTERTAEEQERTFLEALRAGRDERHRPSIRDLERHAPAWATLVPPEPGLKAEIASRIAERHRFRRGDAPRLRAALALDEPSTTAALERRAGDVAARLYADDLPLAERLRWLRARLAWALEDLPPFWSAFALTLTETVGGGALAIPIALAGLGLVPALGVVVAFGLLSTITIAALAEAITRNGPMRYGTAYLGRLVGDYLGRPGIVALSVALFVFSALVFMFCLVGVGAALAGATPVPAVVWVALLFGVELAILRRDSLDATVASALVIGALNLAILLALSVMALGSFDPANVAGASAAAGAISTPTAAGLVFGVLLAVYFGHSSAANAAKVVLSRDPSGRSLLRGTVAAMLTVVAIYCLVVVAFNGAIEPARLVGFEGTVLEPLADEVGPPVQVLGSIYVVLAMGLNALHFALGLSNQAQEALGARRARRAVSGGSPPSGPHHRHRDFLVGSAPAIAVFVVVEVLFVLGLASFAGLLSVGGALAVPLLGGMFPMLMVLAARRRGEYVPGTVIRFIAHPLVVALVSTAYLVGLAVHGLLVAESLPERATSLGVGVAMVGVVAIAVRRGSFRPRAVIELRREPGSDDVGRYGVVVAGREANAEVVLAGDGEGQAKLGPDRTIRAFDSLRSATFRLVADGARELKVWTHAVTLDGDSVPLPAAVRVAVADGSTAGPVEGNGSLVVPLPAVGDEPDRRIAATVRLVPPARRP